MKPLDLYLSYGNDFNYQDPITKYKLQLQNATADNYYLDPTNPDLMEKIHNEYSEPRVHELNYDKNRTFELGLGVQDNTNEIDKIKNIMDYTHKTFEQTKTTEFMNENQERLWFWNNVGFLFSEGLILEAEYRVVFNEVLEYFNKANQAFLPNVYKILNYDDPIIKTIEQNYNIANGNYHFLLIPFVMTDNPELLAIAPEKAYKRYGPIDVFTDTNQIVQYMCEVMYKYGTMKNLLTDAVANKLNVDNNVEDNRYFKHAQRVMNISAKSKQNEPMRMNRKGYFDPNTTDNFDLINPQEDITKYAPQRQYFTPGDLKWSDLNGEKSKESNYYRKPVKAIPRTNLTNTGNEYGQNVKRNEGKMTLWNQIHNDKKGMNVPAGFVDTSMKGGMLKVNTMYESETKRKNEEDKFQVYGDTDRLTAHAEIDPLYKSGSAMLSGNSRIYDVRNRGNQQNQNQLVKGKLIKDSNEQVYIDTVADRENMPVWNQSEINKVLESENVSKLIKMPAECTGIFAQTRRNISFK